MIDCADCVNKDNLPSACCHDVAIVLDEPTSLKWWGDARWMVAHENVSVCKRQSDGHWAVVFKTPCTMLEDDGRCKIYSQRPQLCADYERKSCMVNGGGILHEIEFHTIEEIDEYIKNEVLEKLHAEAKEVFKTKRQLFQEARREVSTAISHVKQAAAEVEKIVSWPFKDKTP